MRGLSFISQKTRKRNTHVLRLPKIKQYNNQKPVLFAPDLRNFKPNISR
jgi:hypothetical protein